MEGFLLLTAFAASGLLHPAWTALPRPQTALTVLHILGHDGKAVIEAAAEKMPLLQRLDLLPSGPSSTPHTVFASNCRKKGVQRLVTRTRL
jgi:hypothetical protein